MMNPYENPYDKQQYWIKCLAFSINADVISIKQTSDVGNKNMKQSFNLLRSFLTFNFNTENKVASSLS